MSLNSPAVLALRIDAHIVEHGEEDRQPIGIELARTRMIPERRLGHMAEAVGVQLSSASGGDPRTLQRLAQAAGRDAIEAGDITAAADEGTAAQDVA